MDIAQLIAPLLIAFPILGTQIPAYFVLGPLVVLFLMLIVLMSKRGTPLPVATVPQTQTAPSANVPIANGFVAPPAPPLPPIPPTLSQAPVQTPPPQMSVVPPQPIVPAPVPLAQQVVTPAAPPVIPPVSSWKPAEPAPTVQQAPAAVAQSPVAPASIA